MNEFDSMTMIDVSTERSIDFALLERAAEYIESHPEEFNMQEWGYTAEPSRWDKLKARILGRPEPESQTVGCLACHIAMLGGAKPEENTPAIAQRLLGITDTQARSLFYVDDWPKVFRLEFEDNENSARAQAWICGQRVRRFIATNGSE